MLTLFEEVFCLLDTKATPEKTMHQDAAGRKADTLVDVHSSRCCEPVAAASFGTIRFAWVTRRKGPSVGSLARSPI